ncbi:DUF3343 domain-containing protein [Sinanaerobacter chloroacetimidivorans]|uniref:DUF3343 domain-containing protein n=1 Tax=Sinanaerobacter chloroacetimidivorans TaxID=2818044 RepID=A0A8J7W6U6_9FIRM|nr:DUF3343 domain-containing protein [Sinanaerobacter chloroacetimidivorans]MBR0600005.1 DUF3343 domain-containing protein [Sinanaerobacter chloroacetimidivorans]
MNEYVIAFSSFYRAVYAQERLQENRIRSTLKKLPPDLLRSCGYAVYLKTNSIFSALDILEKNQILARGVYEIEYFNGTANYKQIA